LALAIEDYALIGDLQTSALVDRNGSIDWMCLPRFDSDALFAALLGDETHGHWSVAPRDSEYRTSRRYRPNTLVLETEFETATGAVRLTDFMPPRDDDPVLVRTVEGLRGHVEMRTKLVIRFNYGMTVPWVQRVDDALLAVAGPDALWIWSDVPMRGQDLTTVADFKVAESDRVSFTLMWKPSHQDTKPRRIDPERAGRETTKWWEDWSDGCTYQGEFRGQVVRSLITLKALTYGPTGGIVAAPTTSLPEKLGGERNWDYRYCWVRDATFSLYALMSGGYRTEAIAWRDWLLRAVAGHPEQLQIMYGPAGERRLTETELPWLPGYQDSKPVRIGNDAAGQFQLDVFGELMDAMHQARRHGIAPSDSAWDFQRALMEVLESTWYEPDDGIWEIRGPRQHFTHSKVMSWVAADRAVKAVEHLELPGPVEKWKALRNMIHREVLDNGYDSDLGAFTQRYGSKSLDGSLLMIPLVGFLPASDSRVVSTMEAIQERLTSDGLVLRYIEDDGDIDDLPSGEGVFLPCSFWMADNLWMTGRTEEAMALFDRLMGLSNDVGLFSEEYDPAGQRLLGNFPQAFTHVSMVNTALNVSGSPGPSHHRSTG
jgi:GH15 family glucan-1,4-alpha-glucosidase